MLKASSGLITSLIPSLPIPSTSSIPSLGLRISSGAVTFRERRIAIADLELKKANVEAQRAELERRYSEVESQTREEILTLVLEYEEALRQAALITAQLNNHQIITKVMEIDYRFGGSSTESYLAAVEKQERLENQFIRDSNSSTESLRKILSLTGFDLPIQNLY